MSSVMSRIYKKKVIKAALKLHVHVVFIIYESHLKQYQIRIKFSSGSS